MPCGSCVGCSASPAAGSTPGIARRRCGPSASPGVKTSPVSSEVFEAGKQRYGAPRIHAELRDRGHGVSKRTIAKLMKENGIRPPLGRRRAPITTDSRHAHAVAPNLLGRELEYIEIFYNRRRRHSSVRYRTPAQARIDMTMAQAA